MGQAQMQALAAGIELDDADREAIRSQDWSQVGDDELATRVSKGNSWR